MQRLKETAISLYNGGAAACHKRAADTERAGLRSQAGPAISSNDSGVQPKLPQGVCTAGHLRSTVAQVRSMAGQAASNRPCVLVWIRARKIILQQRDRLQLLTRDAKRKNMAGKLTARIRLFYIYLWRYESCIRRQCRQHHTLSDRAKGLRCSNLDSNI